MRVFFSGQFHALRSNSQWFEHRYGSGKGFKDAPDATNEPLENARALKNGGHGLQNGGVIVIGHGAQEVSMHHINRYPGDSPSMELVADAVKKVTPVSC